MGRMLAMFCLLSVCGAQEWKRKKTFMDPEGPERHHEKTCSNLTQVLDNWKYAIITEVKDLLVNDHSSVLPDYNRIKPLSEALADLYKQFNALKNELVELSANFDKVEEFVDDLQAGKFVPPAQRPVQALPPRLGARLGALRPALRSRLGPNRSNVANLMSVRRRGRIATPRS